MITKTKKKNSQEILTANWKKVKEARGLTVRQLAELLKISNTAMEMYLKGEGNPTVETIDLMANALDIPPAALLSETWIPGRPFSESLEPAVQMPHPPLEPFVVKLMDTLQELIYYYSEVLYNARAENSVEEIFPEQMYHYTLNERQGKHRFGILAHKKWKDIWIPVADVPSFPDDAAAVSDLARKCTQLQLSPEHLPDVAENFVAREEFAEASEDDLLLIGR